ERSAALKINKKQSAFSKTSTSIAKAANKVKEEKCGAGAKAKHTMNKKSAAGTAKKKPKMKVKKERIADSSEDDAEEDESSSSDAESTTSEDEDSSSKKAAGTSKRLNKRSQMPDALFHFNDWQ
ncbi:unnamed protein product, partial [Amoebophrya sp. A120]